MKDDPVTDWSCERFINLQNLKHIEFTFSCSGGHDWHLPTGEEGLQQNHWFEQAPASWRPKKGQMVSANFLDLWICQLWDKESVGSWFGRLRQFCVVSPAIIQSMYIYIYPPFLLGHDMNAFSTVHHSVHFFALQDFCVTREWAKNSNSHIRMTVVVYSNSLASPFR